MSDPLHDMAVRAGFFPQVNDAPGDVYGYNPDYSPEMEVPPELAGEYAGEGLRPPDLEMQSAPPEVPEEGPITQSRTGSSTSQSKREFSEASFGRVEKQDRGLYHQYDIAAKQAQASGDYEAGLARSTAQPEIDAANALTTATVNKLTGAGQQALLMKTVEDGFAADELRANMESEAQAHQAKMDYQAALADFRATKINANELYDNMGDGLRFGTAVVAFVHGYLGAKGIKTDAMNILSSAVDRNIAAQVQNLKTKGEVSEGFKSLWYMQRSQSASDTEARTRVRGFLLEGAKQHVVANMAQYESGLATAQGQAAIAAIDKELAKNLIDINRHIDGNKLQLRQQALTLHGQKLQAAASAASTAVARQDLAFRKDQASLKAQGEARAAALANLVPDPSKSGGGAMRWEWREGISQPKKDEALTKMEGYTTLVKDAEEYRDLVRKYEAIPDGIAKTRFASTEGAKMRELQIKIVLDDTLRRTGKAATQQEREAIEQRIPMDTWATRADVETIVSGFEKHGINDVNTMMGTLAYDLGPDDPRRNIRGSQGGFARGEEADAKATYNQAGKGPPVTSTEEGQRALSGPGMFEESTGAISERATDAKFSVEQHWDAYKKANPDDARVATLKAAQGIGVTGENNVLDRSSLAVKAPAFVTGMGVLAAEAKEGKDAALKTLKEYAMLGDQLPGAALPNGLDANSKEGQLLINAARWELTNLFPKTPNKHIGNTPDYEGQPYERYK